MRDLRSRKGAWATVRRSALLPIRYGVTIDKLERDLRLMVETGERAEFKPVIGVPATVLERHSDIVGSLVGVDLLVHGYEHVAYGLLTDEEQGYDLDRACSVFTKFSLPACGFRAPYLCISSGTPALLRSRGFVLDSSQACMSLPDGATAGVAALPLARRRYGNVDQGPLVPRVDNGLVEFPVSLPDDELIIDALGIRNAAAIERIFTSMVTHTAYRMGLLVLQVHPERFPMCIEAVKAACALAADMGGWNASFPELQEWIHLNDGSIKPWPHGHSFAFAITGDLDALTLGDFGRRAWSRVA